MKKLLIIIPSFSNGGTISSLINLLHYLNREYYTIDILAISAIGPNYSALSEYANVLNPPHTSNNSRKTGLRNTVVSIVKSIKKLLCRLGFDISPLVFSLDAKKWDKKRYDCVIGFQEGQATLFASLFKTTKKLCWIHSDYENMLRIASKEPEHLLYKRFNAIICVSSYTKNSFLKFIPEAAKKTFAIHNCLNTERIYTLSRKTDILPDFFSGAIKIVSVGRLDPVKRFHLIPSVQKTIKSLGLNTRWYILGGGSDNEKQLIEKEIMRNCVGDSVFMMGNQDNPYPFMANSDLVVCTSFSEACPYVINEAKVLGVPIVSTDFSSVKEYINSGNNGIVSTVDQLATSIFELLTNKKLYMSIKNNLRDWSYDNGQIVKEIDSVLSHAIENDLLGK